MFRFEHLNDEWIQRCARYLERTFGGQVEGRTVIDYASGRGNWSLAFLVAGAGKVIAIDAAASNVEKLSRYALERKIDKLEVIRGNILQSPIEREADILWAYGVLPCIAEPLPFLKALAGLARADGAESLIYSYDAGSLRQVVVEIARQGQTYESYEEFAGDSFLFNPAARLRARDDLTAPVVQFHAAGQLWDLALQSGHAPLRFVESFDSVEGVASEEFRPHHLHCRLPKDGADHKEFARGPMEPGRPSVDLRILKEFGSDLMASSRRDRAKKLAVGLLNTHFAALKGMGYRQCVIEDCLYLLYAFLVNGAEARTELQALVLDLAASALKGIARKHPGAAFADSTIVNFLVENRIRM